MSLFAFGFKKDAKAGGAGSAQSSPRQVPAAAKLKPKPKPVESDDDEDADLARMADMVEQAVSQQVSQQSNPPSQSSPTKLATPDPAVRMNGSMTKKARLEPPREGRSARSATKKRRVVIDSDDDEEDDDEHGNTAPAAKYKGAAAARDDDGDDEDFKVDSDAESSEDEYNGSVAGGDSSGSEAENSGRGSAATKKRKLVKKGATPATGAPKQGRALGPASPLATSRRPLPATVTPPRGKISRTNSASSGRSLATPSSPIHRAPGSPKAGVLSRGDHEHHRLSWLQPDQVRDAKQRRPDDPDYNPATLFVPDGYLRGDARFHAAGGKPRKITPAMTAWWGFKQRYFDTVLFFKVGKFYEIYHMDADTAVQHLSLMYMSGDVAHCGFPEKAYGKFSEQLLDLGYRVARVEQTETPQQQKERTGKNSGPVRREVCGIISPGTRTLDIRDGLAFEERPNTAVQLISVFESGQVIGVCVLDATTARFSVGAFEDEANRARLRMLLARENPAELVYCLGNVSEPTRELLERACPSVPGAKGSVTHTLVPKVASTSAAEAKALLAELGSAKSGYFADGQPTLLTALEQGGPTGEAALAALSVCLRVLKRALIDRKLVSMANFTAYVLPGTDRPAPEFHGSSPGARDADDALRGEKCVLDGQAIANLDLFHGTTAPSSAASSGADGSLIGFLDHCVTRFGKRELRRWVASPLQSGSEIRSRQVKITGLIALLQRGDVVPNLRSHMRSLPDMERMLQRVHSIGVKDPNHPDSRAVLYDFVEYNKGKIQCLVQTLTGARIALKVLDDLGAALRDCAEEIPAPALEALKPLCDVPTAEWAQLIDRFARSFDQDAALKTGSISPIPGTNDEHDAALENVETVKASFNSELERVREAYSGKGDTRAIKYWHPKTGRYLYQIEIPASLLAKRDPPSFLTFKSKTAQVRRFHSQAIQRNLDKLSVAEAMVEETKKDATRKVFEAFDRSRSVWERLLRCIRELDCLLSLATVSGNASDESPMCVPEILDSPEHMQHPILALKEARHPCVAQMLERQGKSYIPNDFSVGGQNSPTCMLLTGPNMGGKSSLCRQTAIAIIMAQIGCYVNAESARLTPVDRIFTRLGASDFIMSGQSTFFVELDETATVLHHATSRSFVMLDELGRGTSTHDGAAIAYSVVDFLVKLRARTVFATHYHALVEDFSTSSAVKTAHMSCFAREEPTTGTGEGDELERAKAVDVTFLYKLAPGPSDKSHGLNVARLAKLPESIILTAQRESAHFERNFLAEQVAVQLQHALEVNADEATLEKIWRRAQQVLAIDAGAPVAA